MRGRPDFDIKDSNTLFVGNLPFFFDERDIDSLLRDFKVVNIYTPYDRERRRYKG